jgi:ferritin
MSIVKTPKSLDDASIKILTDRLRDEYTAHYFYRNATNWCAGVGYAKAAAFFANESESELEHAAGIQKFLVDWNVDPLLPSIKPNIQFTDLIDIINKAYAMEYGLFDSYCKNSTELFNKDINTFDFLTKYRGIQNDAVIEYSDLLNAAMLINTDNKFDILYFEQTYFQ